MRKKIVAILLIATMAMGIAACGGSGDKKDDNTITVWCWDKTFNIFAMEEAAKIYQEDHQDVKIDIVEVGDVRAYFQLFDGAAVRHHEPDGQFGENRIVFFAGRKQQCGEQKQGPYGRFHHHRITV